MTRFSTQQGFPRNNQTAPVPVAVNVGASIVASANVFQKATELYSKATEKTEQFISSIAKNSFSVQAGNSQAEVIKLQADLASEKISGPALREYIVQASKTDSAIQEVVSYFYKWSANLLTVINRVLEYLIRSFSEYVKWFDEKLGEFKTWLEKAIVDSAGKFAGPFARMAAEEFFRRWFAEKAKDEKLPDAVIDFFKTQLPAEMLDPLSLPTPFNVRL